MAAGSAGALPPDMQRDTLCGDYSIVQPRSGQRYTTDDMLAAWLALRTVAAGGGGARRFLDLGSGLCSVPMILLWAFGELGGIGVEQCFQRARMGAMSLAANGIAGRFALVCGDLRSVRLRETFPIVTSSPPYHEATEGPISPNDDKARARFELSGAIDDYVQAAAAHLAPGGCFVTVYPCRHAGRVHRAAVRARLSLEREVTVVPRAGKPPLVSLFAFVFSGRGRGVRETLTIRDPARGFTAEYRAARRLVGFPDPK